MVVGNGMIANVFKSYKLSSDVVIFASGVSNSLETDQSQFQREYNLLKKIRYKNPDKLLVYFSTCSISDPDRANTAYVNHKVNIESELASWQLPYLILRLPVVIGRTNLAKTFPFFLYDRIKSGESFNIWQYAVRYPIDIDDMLKISIHLISQSTMQNQTVNIAFRSYPVLDIVHEMETILGQIANMMLIDQGCFYDIDRTLALCLASELNINCDEYYLSRVLHKYFFVDMSVELE